MMQQEEYHHANMLDAQLRKGMSSRDKIMLAMVQEFASMATKNEEPINNPPLSQTVNTVSQDTM